MAKILLFPELRPRGVVHCRRHLDRLEAQGKFPKRVLLGDRRVGWVADEIDAYVDHAIASRSMKIGTLGSFDVRRHPRRRYHHRIS